MAKSNYWLKSGLINIFQNFSTVVFGFFSFYILVRILTKEEYGTWVLFLSSVSIIEIARNGLTQEALVKYLSSANRSDKKKITTAVFLINLCATLLISITLIIIGPLLAKSWHSAELTHMFHLYIFVFFVSGVLNQLNCIEQASLNFTGIFYSNITRQIIIFGYVFYCVLTHTHTTLILLSYAQIIAILVATIVALIYTNKRVSYTKKIDWKWVKKILHFGKYTFGVSLSAILSGSIDQMMLGSMLSKSASGVFNIAVRITNLTDIPTNAMATIVYPQSSIRIEKEGQQAVKYLYEKSVGVILAFLIPIVILIYLFADYVIHFIAGNKYADAIPLLKITLLTCVFSPFARQAGTIFNSTGRSKINFYLILVTTSVIIIANFFLIRQFGVMGAAYGTLISGSTGFMLSQFFLKSFII